MTFRLEKVHYMPKVLESGVLYYSEEYETAAHLCACGCNSKVRTPIDETEWSFEEEENGPTLYPSIGNWQKPCRSHYFIRNGGVIWCTEWTEEEVKAGQRFEHRKRIEYYERKHAKKRRWWSVLLGFFKKR